jgi:hypothetical protein
LPIPLCPASYRPRSLFALVLTFAALQPGCSAPLEEYVSEEGKFRISLPSQPLEEKGADLPAGLKKVSLAQQSGSYAVGWQDLPPGETTPDERLDQACDGALQSLKAKSLSRKEITLASRYPGRELVMEWPDGKGIVHERMYLVDRRLYQVLVSGPKWWVESATSRKVIESFQVIGE